tara:strand:+ start:836 stop:1735 length:900 start_codon:yes stop_codon:yes gene_type:complete
MADMDKDDELEGTLYLAAQAARHMATTDDAAEAGAAGAALGAQQTPVTQGMQLRSCADEAARDQYVLGLQQQVKELQGAMAQQLGWKLAWMQAKQANKEKLGQIDELKGRLWRAEKTQHDINLVLTDARAANTELVQKIQHFEVDMKRAESRRFKERTDWCNKICEIKQDGLAKTKTQIRTWIQRVGKIKLAVAWNAWYASTLSRQAVWAAMARAKLDKAAKLDKVRLVSAGSVLVKAEKQRSVWMQEYLHRIHAVFPKAMLAEIIKHDQAKTAALQEKNRLLEDLMRDMEKRDELLKE